MPSSEKLDKIIEGVLDNYISECLEGKRQIPPWLHDSLERVYIDTSKSVAKDFLKELREESNVN